MELERSGRCMHTPLTRTHQAKRRKSEGAVLFGGKAWLYLKAEVGNR